MYPDPIPPHVYSVDEVIEALCQEGCQSVRAYIEQLENNTPMELLDGLSEQEKQAVLLELRSIMEVYDRCSIGQPLDHPAEIEE